jgi:TonB-dependent SusC/RagA subfamily outer membrane receptor
MRTYFTLVLLGLILASASLKGQEHYDRTIWAPIERDLQFGNYYGELGIRLNTILKDAVKVRDVIATARAMYTLNRLHDRQYEDTLFFYNSRYQDSIILQPQADTLLKVIMLHLKARRIMEFLQNHRGRPRAALYRSYMPGEDYATMSSGQLDSLSNLYFAKAISLSAQAGQPDIKRLAWISTDPYGLLYTPKLSDFIYLEQVSTKAGAVLIQTKQLPENWIHSPVNDLIREKIIDSSFGALYASWINSRSDDPSVKAFIDLQLRRNLFNQVQQQDQQAFDDYLYAQTKSVHAPVRASAVYQLCMLWTAGRAVERYKYAKRVKQPNYKKAIQLYASAKPLLDSFAVLDASLTNMVSELTATYYSISSNGKHQPYRASITELEYRNINKLYLRVIKLKQGETTYDGSYSLPQKLMAYPVFKDTVINLPAYGDYNIHSAYLKLTPLPPGKYTWLFSDQPIDTNNVLHVRAVSVNVSNITTVPMFGRMYVLKSDSGFPLESAKVKMVYEKDDEDKVSWHTVNKEGWVPLNNDDLFYAEVYHGGDTAIITTVPTFDNYFDNAYVKDEYDSKAEYYEDNLYMKVFTDRSIYRPGQQVFFKGIVFTRDIRTGEEVILNWGNLKLPFYQKWLARIGQKFANEKIELVLTDAFNKPIDTLAVKPNKYGSFSGTFTIPKQAPTGEWSIETDWFEVTNDGETFMVEEYKKPTMFLQLEQPTKLLRPGDSIPVVVKVKSFAGADLDDVEVDIRISEYGRTGDFSLDTTIISKKGLVKLFIVDSVARSLRDSSQKEEINYRINVTALNTEGETVKEDEQISISNRPVEIINRLPQVLDAAAKPTLRFGTSVKGGAKLGSRLEVTIKEVVKHSPMRHPDTWLYPIAALELLMGKIDTMAENEMKERTWERTLAMDGKDSTLLSTLPAGEYKMEVKCIDGKEIVGEYSRSFKILNTVTKTAPAGNDFTYLPSKVFEKGKPVQAFYGNWEDSVFVIYASGRMHRTKQSVKPVFAYQEKRENQGLQTMAYRIAENGLGNATVYRVTVRNGYVQILDDDLYPNAQIGTAEVIVEQYRQKLAPSAREKFSVRIRTKEYLQAAELLTVMYDASLDKLEQHNWDYQIGRYYWSTPRINAPAIGQSNGMFNMQGQISSTATLPVSWSTYIDPIFEQTYNNIDGVLQGRASGVSVNYLEGPPSALNEVVVIGYSTARKKDLAGSVVTIRGTATLTSANIPLIIIDGVPFTGDLSTLDPSQLADIAVLKGADATSIYGSRAANGVVLISTSGKVQIPVAGSLEAPEIPPVIRKNFQETAFFYPQIHADRKGYYNIEFTMPENLTTWKWMLLAHTMKGEFGYAEKTITTQLSVMVQPAMPRFLYQGDKMILRSRISNLDTIKTEGTLRIAVEDAVTGVDLTSAFTEKNAEKIAVEERSNQSGAFPIRVPDGQLNPVKIRISYATSTFSDGEELILPVLSNKFFFSTTQVVELKEGKQTLPAMKAEPAMNPLGIGYFIDPLPKASMIYALPGLVNYNWDCAEQTFSKIYGYAIAYQLMRTDTALARSWSRAVVPDGNELPMELQENIIPWSTLNKNNINQQRELYQLFDTASSIGKINELLTHLGDMQLGSGAMPWFKGGKADDYITAYLVKSIGRFNVQGLKLGNDAQQKRLQTVLGKMIKYLDAQVYNKDSYAMWSIVDARGYHLKAYPADSLLRRMADSLLSRYDGLRSLMSEAEYIIMLKQWYPEGSPNAQVAQKRLESLRQQAVNDPKNGMRWKEVADNEDLSISHEETVARLAEAFSYSPYAAEVQQGIVQWLLQNRKDHSWGSTKATAQVVGLLASNAKDPMQAVTVEADGLKVSNDLFSGKLSAYRELQNFPETMTLSAPQATKLGINYYYLSSTAPTPVRQDLQLNRQLYYYDDSAKNWRLVEVQTVLRVGQRVRVELEIVTSKMLQYVTIQDRRAASFDVPGLTSGYQWESNLSYYQSVRDASMQFFASRIPAGRTMIRYEMVVSKEGEFSHGHASLSCMYNPDRKAYSSSSRITVQQ